MRLKYLESFRCNNNNNQSITFIYVSRNSQWPWCWRSDNDVKMKCKKQTFCKKQATTHTQTKSVQMKKIKPRRSEQRKQVKDTPTETSLVKVRQLSSDDNNELHCKVLPISNERRSCNFSSCRDPTTNTATSSAEKCLKKNYGRSIGINDRMSKSQK